MIVSADARRHRQALRIVSGVFAVALVIRLIFLWQLHMSGLWDLLRQDALYYHDWALRIAGGEILGNGTFEKTPLYAYALGFLFKISGNSLFLPRIAQALIGAGTCALVSFLGLRIFGRAEALIGGLLLAFYGPALFHESQIMKTVLTIALSTATAAALYFSRGSRWQLLGLSGLLLGTTALVQENMNMILPFLLVWIWFRSPRGTGPRGILAILAGFVMMVAPATLRNYAVSGEFVLITSGGGEVFYTGNHEYASGKYQPPAFIRPDSQFEHEDFRREAARRLGVDPSQLSRRQSDAFWWEETLRVIRADPGRYVALLWDKLKVFFTWYERPDNYSYENFQRFVPILRFPLIGFGLLAPLGLFGIAITQARWRDLIPLYLTVGAYIVSALLFFTQSRYRMPLIPLLCLFAAHGLVHIFDLARDGKWKSLAVSVPAVLLLTLAVNRDPGHSESFVAQRHGILGEMMLHAGRDDEAVEEFSEAIRILSNGPTGSEQNERVLAASHWGIFLAAESGAESVAPKDKIAHLRAAVLSPDADLRHDALNTLGLYLADSDDYAGAAEAYAGAVAAAPDLFELRLRLAEAQHRSGQPEAALATVAAALATFPESDPALLASAHFGSALIYLNNLPDTDKAAFHLREVLRLDPGHPRSDWIRRRLAELEKQQ